MSKQRTLLIAVNVDWFFISHRLPIAIEALKRGYKVIVATQDTGKFEELKSLGITPELIPVNRSGTNFFQEFTLLTKLVRLYRKERPEIIHHVTLKIAIYGSIAASIVGLKNVVNAISGLGFNFTSGRKTLAQKFIRGLMFMAFYKRPYKFIFQNPDDYNFFKDLGYASLDNTRIIKGSGVDLKSFNYDKPKSERPICFVMTARILKDKGVQEFIKASVNIDDLRPGLAMFKLIGGLDPINPAGYSEAELKNALKGSSVNWMGYREDIKEQLINSHVVVLPSYREGLPKSLVEACAIGRAIITTDAIGCRECVVNGENGFLVEVKNVESLTEAMIKFIDTPELIESMSKESRKLAESTFSIQQIVNQTFQAYE